MNNPGSLLRFIRRLAVRCDADATDRQLLERFAAERDQIAFTTLVARHGPMVLGVCRRVLPNAHDAEDTFQATFLVLARKAGSIRRPEALGNWLFGVAYRTALEARAKAAKRRARERELAEEPTVLPSCVTDWSDLRAVLDGEVNRLSDKYRSAFVLCYLEGRTNEEAARLLRCPKGTILSRLAWARQRLRDRLVRRGVTLSATGVSTVCTADSLTAAVSAELVRSTTQAALLFACAQSVGSFEVLTLAKGVLKAMLIEKLKTASAILLAVAIFGGGLAWLGQATRASAPKEAPNPAPHAKAEGGQLDTLFTLEKRVWEAVKQKDFESLRKTCARDYVAILSDGSRITRNEFFLALPFFEIESYSLSDAQLLPLGPDAAILLYKAESQTFFLWEAEKVQTQISSTWVRRNGEWQNVFTQETLIED
jgi:RNA polymerase sigma factor (sigma-70 family)